jgi:hypothetical protein
VIVPRRATILLSLAIALAGQASAMEPVPPPPHNPLKARCGIQKIVDAINARQIDEVIATTKVYTDLLGEVEPTESAAFLDMFGKKADLDYQDSLRLKDVSLLSTDGLYVIDVDRHYSETAKRSDRHNMSHWSVWIIAFASDEVASMRQATELWPFTLHNPAFGSGLTCSRGSLDG